MSNLIPFDSGKLPAYLKSAKHDINADMLAHAMGISYPAILGVNGGFVIKRGKERQQVMNPLDPDSPATYIEAVILRVSPTKSKAYYATAYADADEAVGKNPDCQSKDGIKPDASVAAPQNSLCITCPHNAFGSARNGKGKACSDTISVAVSTANTPEEPMFFKVKGASLRPFSDYGKQVSARGAQVNQVVTRISFDPEVVGKYKFRPMGFLDEVTYGKVENMYNDEVVKEIVGVGTGHVVEDEDEVEVPQVAAPKAIAAPAPAPVVAKTKTVTDGEVEAAIAKAKAKPAEAPAPKAAPAAVAEEVEVDIDLDNLSFDDE
jgi:hypothetical protein